MKNYILYALMVIGFFIFSEFLINVGLNSNYEDIRRLDDNSQIVVYQADATYVNGRIRGIIKNTNEINGKYLKIELYSERDVLMGKSYIEIKETEDDNTQPFELLFKAKDVDSYKIQVVDEKDPEQELEILPEELTRPEIILATALTLLIFWV